MRAAHVMSSHAKRCRGNQMFRVCNSCGAFDIDDNHGCDGKVKESLAKSPLTEKAREYKEKYFPDDQAQKPECPFCGDKRGIEHPSPCVCRKSDVPAREWIIDDAYDLVAGPHPGKERIHVIEKSHAEALAKELKRLKIEAEHRTIERDRAYDGFELVKKERDALAKNLGPDADSTWQNLYEHTEGKLSEYVDLIVAKDALIMSEREERDALRLRVTELEGAIESGTAIAYEMTALAEELATAKGQIEFLTRGLSGAEHLWQERLTQANQQIKFLEENMERKEHYWSGIKEKLKEREQRLVAALEKINSMFFGLQWDGLGEKKSEAVRKIRELLLETLKAHNGEA